MAGDPEAGRGGTVSNLHFATVQCTVLFARVTIRKSSHISKRRRRVPLVEI